MGVQVNIMYVRVRHNFKNHNMHACTILDTSSDILIFPFNLYDIVCVFARIVRACCRECVRARACVCVCECVYMCTCTCVCMGVPVRDVRVFACFYLRVWAVSACGFV